MDNNQKHQDSVAKYPWLSLSDGEYVIEEVKRHPIGLIPIWFFTGFTVFLFLAMWTVYVFSKPNLEKSMGNLPSVFIVGLIILVVIALVLLGGYIATVVYNRNRFYLTNESVFDFIQTSLFSNRTQVINLVNIEDVSYQKAGLLQQFFNFGSVQLSTKGEESKYNFTFVPNPDRIVAEANDAVEIALKTIEGS